jgi:hypothetical protein
MIPSLLPSPLRARAVAGLLCALLGLHGCGGPGTPGDDDDGDGSTAPAAPSAPPELNAHPKVAGGVVDTGTRTGNLQLDLSGQPATTFSLRELDTVDGARNTRIDFADGRATNVRILPPDQDPPSYAVDDVAVALSHVPVALRAEAKNLVLGGASPGGGAMAQTTYDDGGTIFVYARGDGLSPGKLGGVLAHEAGHAWLNNHATAELPPWTSYEDILAGDEPAASPYATAGAFEDFAETAELYAAVRGTALEEAYRALLPKRFAFFDVHVFHGAAAR